MASSTLSTNYTSFDRDQSVNAMYIYGVGYSGALELVRNPGMCQSSQETELIPVIERKSHIRNS